MEAYTASKPAMQEVRFTVFQSIPQTHWEIQALQPDPSGSWRLQSPLTPKYCSCKSYSLLGAWNSLCSWLEELKESSLQNPLSVLGISKETQNSSPALIYLSKSCVPAGGGMGVLKHELELQNTAVSHIRFVLPRDGYSACWVSC